VVPNDPFEAKAHPDLLALDLKWHIMFMNEIDTLEAISTRGYPVIFQRIAQNDVPISLGCMCEPVKMYYRLLPDLYERFPRSRGYLPLWEENMHAVVAFDDSREAYVKYYYGDEEDKVLANSYQQFISVALLELAGSGLPDEELEEVAALLDYSHVTEFFQHLEACNRPDWDKTHTRFLESITD
jgi:hypothetical protein